MNMRTTFETFEGLDHALYCTVGQIDHLKHEFNDQAALSPGVGDFLKAGCEHPVLIRYRYDGSGLAQGYRVGPLCILRIKPDSEIAIEVWLDPDEEFEATMAEDVIEPFRALRNTLYEMEHDNGLDLEFQVPQDLIDNLPSCPLVLREGTLRGLTRATGATVSDEVILTLMIGWNESVWRQRFKDVVKAARTARNEIFRAKRPKETACDKRRENTSGPEHSQHQHGFWPTETQTCHKGKRQPA
jgi:hypothetical protein